MRLILSPRRVRKSIRPSRCFWYFEFALTSAEISFLQKSFQNQTSLFITCRLLIFIWQNNFLARRALSSKKLEFFHTEINCFWVIAKEIIVTEDLDICENLFITRNVVSEEADEITENSDRIYDGESTSTVMHTQNKHKKI